MKSLPFFSFTIPNFSIEEFMPSRYRFADGVDGLREWHMELARRGMVAYGSLSAKKAGLVSREQSRPGQLSVQRIIQHLGLSYPKTSDDNLKRLIR